MITFYESDHALSEYLLFHYGQRKEVLPFEDGPAAALDYPARCVRRFAERIGYREGFRALDLGCSVGRASFELARQCGEVLGVDNSERFIECAQRLQSEGAVAYRYAEQGSYTREAIAEVPPDIDRGRVRFELGDAMFPRPELGTFDVALLANLIDRLPEPSRCLSRLPDLIKPEGYVVITSPYTWLEAYTPREHWLDEAPPTDGSLRPPAPLCRLMEPHFGLQQVADLPFLIREHARKYQWSVAHGTLWKRRSDPINTTVSMAAD